MVIRVSVTIVGHDVTHIFGETNTEVCLHLNRSFTGNVRDAHEHKDMCSRMQPRHGGSLGTITWVQLPVGTGQIVDSDIPRD